MPVYFIQRGDAGPVKIGHSATPHRRLQNMQTGHDEQLLMRRLFDGGEEQERALHRRFREHRIAGEWFQPVPAILDGDIGLPALRVEIPWKPRTHIWNPESYRSREEKRSVRMASPEYRGWLKGRHLLFGAHRRVETLLSRVLLLAELINPETYPGRRRHILKDIGTALVRVEEALAMFPDLMVHVRKNAANGDAWVENRILAAIPKAAEAIAAYHVATSPADAARMAAPPAIHPAPDAAAPTRESAALAGVG